MFAVLLKMFTHILYMLTVHSDSPQPCVRVDVTYPLSENTHAPWILGMLICVPRHTQVLYKLILMLRVLTQIARAESDVCGISQLPAHSCGFGLPYPVRPANQPTRKMKGQRLFYFPS